MDPIYELKLFSFIFFAENDDIPYSSKLKILTWVDEANEEQLTTFLETGQIEAFLGEDWVKPFLPDPGKSSLWSLEPILKKIRGMETITPETAKGLVDNAFSKGYFKGAAAGHTAGYGAGKTAGAVTAVAATALLALATLLGIKVYKSFFSKAARACKGLKGDAKTSCMQRAKKLAQQEKIKTLMYAMKKCSAAKDPNKCKQKFMNKINTIKAQLGEYK